ncbi:MAG: fumarylacetoacetate hydrolase family protein [Chloroflexota bacterium]|nr:fumarylacetoacetate hydrolase family protein [Dehalococcoidia bacterium]MDW8047295.1 fumarylacetoacetate hydrolase family protein [Chloroflexota bacterium]
MPLYVRFRREDGRTGAGLLEEDRIRVIEEPFWQQTVETGEVLPSAAVRLLPPCMPRSIICVGLNYASHLGGRPAPNPPTLFFKPLSSIAGPGDPIVLPAGAGRVDPEGEVVVVIGRQVKRASREEALAAIFGYTAGNDVSAREWQRADGQWWRAKGADTFGVFGPAIATELRHDDIEVVTRIDGREVQRGNTRELILDIPAIVQYVSAVMTLVPGDIIYTGTPGEPQPIAPGQTVEVEIPGVGILTNPVRAEE